MRTPGIFNLFCITLSLELETSRLVSIRDTFLHKYAAILSMLFHKNIYDQVKVSTSLSVVPLVLSFLPGPHPLHHRGDPLPQHQSQHPHPGAGAGSVEDKARVSVRGQFV